ncbi:hypothetical protein GOODEAATRI_009632 [Goodea atripinnis]|uniref:Copine C-terminal domain-containing protein n=1 Tax=Goodea atripinnis TaxID=208336 RepID=A0ABV0PMS6_9TELE
MGECLMNFHCMRLRVNRQVSEQKGEWFSVSRRLVPGAEGRLTIFFRGAFSEIQQSRHGAPGSWEKPTLEKNPAREGTETQNGNVENPYCNGIEGILEAYHQSLKTVQLYGPTNFAPVVNHVARYAAAVQDGSQYFVLLIITDGVISDMAQTKEAIVNVSVAPH